jgi:uncharacterized membrane protein YgcG
MVAGGAPVQRSPVGPPQVFRQSISDAFIVYGKRRVGGLMVFFHPRQVGDDHFRYFVVAIAGHRCKGVVEYRLGDEVVSVDPVSHEVTSGKYSGAAWLEFERGNGATLCDLHTVFVSECGGKWTNNHIGTNTAKLFAKFQMTDDVIQAGMPNMTAVIEGKDDILDPRDATTGYTRNGPLVFYDWMKLPREEGGFGAYEDEIPDDVFVSAQANVADEVVNGSSRYALDAYIVTGSTPSEIRDVMIVNMAGTYTYSSGKHLMRPGYWVPVSQTLSENDLAGPIQVSPFMAADQATNQVSGTYVDPANGYQASPFRTQSVDASDIRQVDLDLAYTTNADQAVRVASIMLRRALAEKTGSWPMNYVGIGVEALDTVALDCSRLGLNNYAWQVGSWRLSSDYGVVLSLREESEDIYTEPTYSAPSTPATIDKAPVVPLSSDVQTALRDTYPRFGGAAITSAESGGVATITIPNFDIEYSGGTSVPITGTTIGSLTPATDYYPYIEVTGIGDAAPTFGVTITYADALNSAAHPLRLYLNQKVTTPVSGSGGSSSGGGYGGGYGGGGAIP